jgi:hypothetical protein
MEDVSGAAAGGDADEAEDSSGKKRKVISSLHLPSFFLPAFLPPFSCHLPRLHDRLTNMSSQRTPVSKTSAKPPAKKLKPVSKAKKSKETIDEDDEEAED